MRQHYYYFLTFFNSFFKFRYKQRLRVLAYHTVSFPENFEKQIIHLKKDYNFISIEDLQNNIYNNIALPKKPMLITFDDGDISVFNSGLPLLEKYNIPSAIFVITSLIGTENDYWIKQVEGYEMNVKCTSYSTARKAVNLFKKMPNSERVELIRDYPPVHKIQLSLTDLEKMKNEGMYIGNHTHTHPMLDKCTDEEIMDEMKESTKVFNELNIEGAEIFAYPNGNANSRTNKILKEFGMKIIFLFDHKINKKNIDPFNISRIRIDTETPFNEFKVKVSGLHSYIFHKSKS